MNDTKTVSQEEYESLLEEFPKLQQFSSQLKTIALLKDDVQEEKDPVMLRDDFETILRLQERLYAKFLTFFSGEHAKQFNELYENAQETNHISQQLKDQLQEERQLNNEMFDKMCFLMVVNPRSAFEDVILKNIERNKKTEDADGFNNWQWGLHFPLMARLRMAFKLVFGRKEVDVNAG